MRVVLAWTVLALSPPVVFAQDKDARNVLAKFDSYRPDPKDLEIYRLDWAESFESAQRRAAQEGRPVLLVLTRNGQGNFYTGHC